MALVYETDNGASMIGPLYWSFALAFAALILFGVPEFLARKYGGETFSRFMRNASDTPFWGKVWLFAWGGLIVGLFVHFNGWCVQ